MKRTYNPCDECPRGIDLRDGSGSDYACRICEFAKLRALGTVAELSALVKARDEGRVVVLDTPRRPMVWGDDDQETCLCPDCGKDLMGLYDGECMVLQCPKCGQYIDGTKVITIAEAEAAIGGVQTENHSQARNPI